MNNIVNSCVEIVNKITAFTVAKALIAFSATCLAYLFGDHESFVLALTVLVVIDFITGIYSAYVSGQVIKSQTAFRTPLKWGMYCLMIAAANLAEMLTPGNWYLTELMAAFLAVTELISVLENVGRAGYAIPLKLLNKLEEFRDKQ